MIEDPGRCALVVGANGGIGAALVRHWLKNNYRVFSISRTPQPHNLSHPNLVWLQCDHSPDQIEQICRTACEQGPAITRVGICIGMLHGATDACRKVMPEKRLEQLAPRAMEQVLYTNLVLPMLWLKALLPRLSSQHQGVISVISARVGSIADNHLGGWYSYRASKAALNMSLKTAAIEFARRNRQIKLIAFHPGTTDTTLSKPFQANVPPGKLFTPEFVAEQLAELMDVAEPDGELSYLDWAGKPIPW